MLTAIMLAASVSAWSTTYYLFWSTGDNPSGFSSQGGADGTTEFTWNLSSKSSGTNYYFLVSSTNSYTGSVITSSAAASDIVSSITSSTERKQWNVNDTDYYFYRVSFSSAGAVTVTYNSSTKKITLSREAAVTYTVSTNATGGSIYPTIATVTAGQQAEFTFTPSNSCYTHSSSSITASTGNLSRNGNTFTVTPTANTTLTVTYTSGNVTITPTASPAAGVTAISPTSSTVACGSDNTQFTLTLASGYVIDISNCSYSGECSGITKAADNKVEIDGVTSSGTLTIAVTNTQVPLVNLGAKPTINCGVIDLNGVLVERYCQSVSAAGFKYGYTADFDPTSPAGSIAAESNPSANNGSFSASLDLSAQADTRYVYFRAYVTAGGATGYSDVVGIQYSPKNLIQEVTLYPTSNFSLPEGFSQEFNVVARSSGKTPSYKWYVDNVVQEGETADTFVFTMPDASSHTVKAEVTGDCSSVETTTARTVSACTPPTITLTADKTAVTPWTTVTITAATTGSPKAYEWSVSGGAEITAGSDTNATLRAPASGTPYTVTYKATANCTGDATVEQTIDITVMADSDDCTH